MPLSKKHLQDVCLVYGGYKRCRYLAQDDTDYTKNYCLKKTSKKDDIDGEVDEFMKDCKAKGTDPKTAGMSLGDNCGGYPILKIIDQGYDCP